MSTRNEQRAARHVQAECGVKYMVALKFVQANWDQVIVLATNDDKVNWKEVPAVAAGLWRRNEVRRQQEGS